MDLSKYASLVNVLSNSWTDVVCSFWTKYPNQYSKHVLSEDVLERKVTSDGKLYTRRLLSKTNSLPKWGGIVFKSNQKQMVHILEESLVDPKTGFMKVYTWNLTYAAMMDVQDCTTISKIADSRDETSMLRQGWVDSSMTGFRRVLRQFGISRWKSNAKKAHLGFLSVLNGAEPTALQNMKEQTVESMKEAGDKARRRARNLASLAATIQSKPESQCS